MTRDLTASFISSLDATEKAPILFFEGEFVSGTLRLWSGIGDLSWNGYTWQGAGVLSGGLSVVEETTDIKASGIQVWLSGVESAALSLVLGDVAQGAAGTIWWGFLNDDGTVVADPTISFKGKIDVPSVEDRGSTGKITITYESHLIDLERPREHRYTAESQAIFYAADQGFEYVPALQEWNETWGRA